MNPTVILSLISDLYSQISAHVADIDRLTRENEALRASLSEPGEGD